MRSFATVFTCLSLAGGIFASPLAERRKPGFSLRQDVVSLDGWNGIQSLSNFDEFRGKDNFDGGSNVQTVIIQEQEVVCRTVEIEIIQQKLVILQEMAKKIITEQICEVETQTIILQQFNGGVGKFQDDLNRKSGKKAGYDKNVTDKYKDVVKDDGSLNDQNMGIDGKSVGNNTVTPSGDNWNDDSSPDSVQAAYDAAMKQKNKESE